MFPLIFKFGKDAVLIPGDSDYPYEELLNLEPEGVLKEELSKLVPKF
jgi:hypothetical protein